MLTQDNIDAQLWRRFGTSRLARTVCAAPTGAANMALYGKMPSVTYQDYPEAQLIILWGVNPSASGIHLIPYVREAQKRGARLIVIDPRTTPLARSADTHLAVTPWHRRRRGACDHRHLFTNGHTNEAFSSRPHARRRDAARARGAVDVRTRGRRRGDRRGGAPRSRGVVREKLPGAHPVRLGTRAHPQRRQRRDWAVLRAAGGSAASSRPRRRVLDEQLRVVEYRPHLDRCAEPDTRLVNMNHLGRALTEYTDPPVNVLFVYNCNPAAEPYPTRTLVRGLEREDLFTVVLEQVMTDTALYADVLLPRRLSRGLRFREGLRPDPHSTRASP